MNVVTVLVLTALLTFSKQTGLEGKLQINISMSKSALRYITDIYDFLKVEQNGERNVRKNRNSYLDLASIERQLLESDTVVTFDGIVTNKETEKGGAQLSFDVSKMPATQRIVESELRIFQNGVPSSSNDTFIVSVHELQPSSQKFCYISSVNTSRNFVGWLRLNITSWTASFKSRKLLYLTVISTDQLEIQPESIGLLNSNDNDETRPFMVIFFKSTQSLQLQKNQQQSVERTYPKTKSFKGLCQRYPLFVDFKYIGWNEHIIAPSGYNAYYCSGECDNPLKKELNITNHAKVLDLVKNFNPRVPEPCCVPNKLSPITVLFLSLEGNIVLSNLKEMVVISCECR